MTELEVAYPSMEWIWASEGMADTEWLAWVREYAQRGYVDPHFPKVAENPYMQGMAARLLRLMDEAKTAQESAS